LTGLIEIIKNNSAAEQITFRKNDILFRENSKPKGIYCIEKGSVKLFKKDHTGENRIIYLASEGEVLGLHPVVNNHPNVSTAEAITDTLVYFISLDDFMEMLDSNNTYKLLVMKNLCSRIESMEEHIIGIGEKMTEVRFADTLLMLMDKYGISKSNKLNVNLSVDELASFTCTSKSYMKKIVSDFSTKGLISLSDKSIRILDLEKIKNITNQI